MPPLLNVRAGFGDTSLFSTSLPVLPHEKCMCSPSHLHNVIMHLNHTKFLAKRLHALHNENFNVHIACLLMGKHDFLAMGN